MTLKEKYEIIRNRKELAKTMRIKVSDLKCFDKRNFTDENYINFLGYYCDVLEALETCRDALGMCTVSCDVTPEDLMLLYGAKPCEIDLMGFDGDDAIIYNSEALDNAIMTRNLPNREKAYDILSNYPMAKYFSILSFNDEYIDNFEDLLQHMRDRGFEKADITLSLYEIHPMFFELMNIFLMDFLDGQDDDDYYEMDMNGREFMLSYFGMKIRDISHAAYKKEGGAFTPIFKNN